MTWNEVFEQIKSKDYAIKLNKFLDEEYANYKIYPPREKMFNAFKLTPLEQVKVVIFGQDPYHEEGQAMGLSFSVPDNIKTPPSLINIYKEIEMEYNAQFRNRGGDLTYLAKQGVLLLNTVLTVRAHEAGSHRGHGWEEFTTAVIKKLNMRDKPVIFVLWGNDAKKKEMYITNPKHYVLKAAHPSPLSAYNGFFGCHHFSKINEILRNNNEKEIDWRLD